MTSSVMLIIAVNLQLSKIGHRSAELHGMESRSIAASIKYRRWPFQP